MINTYLALGDSYTIGEQVLLTESFPYQTVELLRKAGKSISAPEIIAKTGWTTDELDMHIQNRKFLPSYNYVSLLIGVNNQYRGRSRAAFELEFKNLLHFAIQCSGNQPDHVFVLSIPDWGLTPFAEGRDRNKISVEIDEFNSICKTHAMQTGSNFIDITTTQRQSVRIPGFLAEDNLHPAAKEYKKWANILAEAILKIV